MGPKRVVLLLGVATALLVAVVAGALAASPVDGANYAGSLKSARGVVVSFKVSPSGMKVLNVRVLPIVPNHCGASGTPPAQSSIPATIRNGKFHATLNEETSNGAISGTATVTGKFLSGGKAKGVVENPLPGAAECGGNFSYTAKVGK